MLKLRKWSELYKNYGSSLYKVWSETFINYTFWLVSLFESTASYFHAFFTQFYGIVLQLSKVYN